MNDTVATLEALSEALVGGKVADVERLTQAALDEETGPKEVLDGGLIAGMQIVGEQFKTQQIFVPEMLLAAKAMKAGLAILEPLLVKAGVEPLATMVIGTVQGDLHDIGKNIVGMMMRGMGFAVHDLGVRVAPATFVEAVREYHPELVGMSAFLTTTMPAMAKTIAALEKAGLRDQVKVLIGGAAVTPRYAKEINADGYAVDATRAVEKARTVLGIG